jgi:hypothetical protein
VIKLTGSGPYLIHAASSPLEGLYEGAQVEKVSLTTYLERIAAFKGILVTRIESF